MLRVTVLVRLQWQDCELQSMKYRPSTRNDQNVHSRSLDILLVASGVTYDRQIDRLLKGKLRPQRASLERAVDHLCSMVTTAAKLFIVGLCRESRQIRSSQNFLL
jgi:hypothetical protein